MRFMEALTRLVVGTSRFGDHLLKQKVLGIIVAALAFACGAGLASALGREEPPPPAAAVSPTAVAPARAEVSIRDTSEAGAEDAASGRGGCPKR